MSMDLAKHANMHRLHRAYPCSIDLSSFASLISPLVANLSYSLLLTAAYNWLTVIDNSCMCASSALIRLSYSSLRLSPHQFLYFVIVTGSLIFYSFLVYGINNLRHCLYFRT